MTKTRQMRKWLRTFLLFAAAFAAAAFLCVQAQAASINVAFDPDSTQGESMGALQMLFLLTLLAVAPTLIVMMTSFTRIVIVLSLLRNALGVTQTPPNQVVVGLALFLSLFIMSPTLAQVNEQGITPYMNGQITQQTAIQNIEQPVKTFMLKQIKKDDLDLFVSLAQKNGELGQNIELTETNLSGLAMHVVVPAFITSELRRAFIMGFLIFMPFLVIDMIVSSTLMSMGMVMLPPTTIALPFKLMLFIVVDGWGMVIETLVASFR